VLTFSFKWLTVTLVRDALVWLDHWPAGLKLNTELSRFLCLCFMSLTDIWGSEYRGCLPYVFIVLVGNSSSLKPTGGLDLFAPHFPAILRVLGITGRFGMTMILSLLSDLLSMLTGHLYLSYLIATMIFSRQLSIAHSLWNLFRGQNP
jgi:phosphatidylinositol N-acetylglucosaminyltransferase subunit Q